MPTQTNTCARSRASASPPTASRGARPEPRAWSEGRTAAHGHQKGRVPGGPISERAARPAAQLRAAGRAPARSGACACGAAALGRPDARARLVERGNAAADGDGSDLRQVSRDVQRHCAASHARQQAPCAQDGRVGPGGKADPQPLGDAACTLLHSHRIRAAADARKPPASLTAENGNRLP